MKVKSKIFECVKLYPKVRTSQESRFQFFFYLREMSFRGLYKPREGFIDTDLRGTSIDNRRNISRNVNYHSDEVKKLINVYLLGVD